ncbi:unnamed protein product [Clonostachys rhizophaga]|uniref:Xylanolytic transcriptional activator regulatory domain-containing protein n=1 Tax=Clonostachys rhizophaga TaxID=160324 RepID=A0A9N9YTD5_9HYPO|nr:unnamed protein product [Clonostachys rhizophaga]
MQNSNRREEAYIYISTALRLAISHGFHRESRLEKFAHSERVRLNRLWWTVYMQERRLAAATGNPSGINDEAIELPLPTDAPGFSPAGPLCTNIKIGRVVGRIISDLYGKEAETEQSFVSNVQDIVQTLYDISQNIPSELDIIIFGFFDLESAVSAAIVMTLMALYNSACPDQDRLYPTLGLNDALEVLQFLADKGNIFAFQRLQEAKKLWELTRAFLQRARAETNSHNTVPELDHRPELATGNPTNNNDNSSCPPRWETGSFRQPNTEENITGNVANDPNVINMATLDNNLWDEISNIWTLRSDPGGIVLAPGELIPNPLTEDVYRQYYALYNNGQGSFIGDDMEGLTDLGRYLFNSGT